MSLRVTMHGILRSKSAGEVLVSRTIWETCRVQDHYRVLGNETTPVYEIFGINVRSTKPERVMASFDLLLLHR